MHSAVIRSNTVYILFLVVFTTDHSKAVLVFIVLCGPLLYAFIVICPVQHLLLVFGVSCLAL